jgi:hypothetical protein
MSSSRYYPSVSMEKLRKTTKVSVTGVLAVIQIEHMLNIRAEAYCTKLIRVAYPV